MSIIDFFKKKPESVDTSSKEVEPEQNSKLDELIDWSKQYDRVNEIGIRNYQSVHFEECKYIWKNMVPKSGQADSLQGELLRQAEKLHHEACNCSHHCCYWQWCEQFTDNLQYVFP
jgi:hypothetical protein